jgi:tetratricopeptide (TPR) repeat protein
VLERALASGAGGPAHFAMAVALYELDRVDRSIEEWTLALRDDPEDADAFLGRARCFIRLGRWEPALADLESAVAWSGDQPAVLIPTVISYGACLGQRPGHLSRVAGLAWRIAACRLR